MLKQILNPFLVFGLLLLFPIYKSQTKNETIEWINNNLEAGGTSVQYYGDGGIMLKVDSKCNFKVNEFWSMNDKHFDISKRNKIINYYYSGNLKNIALNEVKLIPYEYSEGIAIKCYNGQKCINYKNAEKSQLVSETMIARPLRRKEISGKAIKAINHLIKLCGGKESSF